MCHYSIDPVTIVHMNARVTRPTLFGPTVYVRQLRPTDVPVGVWEAWMEAPLGDEWVVAYRLFVRERRIVIGEVRVFPAEKRTHEPGVWSAHWLGDFAEVPKGGIRGRLLRRVGLTVPIAPMRELIRQLRIEAAKHASRADIDPWLA